MSNQIQLPLSGKGDNQQIEVRPMYVEEWLDSLPYIDFDTTSRIMHEALKASNQVQMRATQRYELILLYNRPYQYYVSSQIKSGAQQTLQTIETLEKQVGYLKHIAIDMAQACRRVLNDSLNKKTLWGQNKPPIDAVLLTLTYLSHALIFSYLEYSPTPKKIWKEIYALYEFTEGLELTHSQIKLPGQKKSSPITVENAFLRIVLCSLADPYHLPFGAIWEIYEQLDQWTKYIDIVDEKDYKDPSGIFAFNLKADMHPLPYAKFTERGDEKDVRVCNTNNLKNLVQKHLDQLEGGKEQDDSLILSPYYAKSLLRTVLKSWWLPAQRQAPRKAQNGKINVCCGMSSIYYFINDENEFISASKNTDPDEIEEINPAINPAKYNTEAWSMVDTSIGGFSITRNDKPRIAIRVGDLICVQDVDKHWKMGITRWLMASAQHKLYKAGIQLIGGQVYPAAIRGVDNNPIDRDYRRAFLTGIPGKDEKVTVVTHHGFHSPDKEFEIFFNNKNFRVVINNLIEGTPNLEQFDYKVS